jgi:hypothetical protein
MKLFEILDDRDQYELMKKLLNREGFSTTYTQLKSGGRQGPHSIRSDAMLKVLFGPSFGTKQGRVQLKNDVWHFAIMSGQGHILSKGSGDEQEVLDFFTDYTMRKVNEDLLSQTERANMLLKLLKKSFHAIADAGDPPAILVHNLQKFAVISAMKTGGWVMVLHKDSKTQKIKAATEEDVIRVLDSLRPVKESQDDVALVWQLAAKEKAKRKRVSMAAEVDGQNFKFIQGEIMNIDMTTRKVDVYAYGRSWYIPMKPDDDDRFTLEKDPQSDFYWVKSIEHDEDL